MGTLTVRSIFIFNYIEDVLFVGYFGAVETNTLCVFALLLFFELTRVMLLLLFIISVRTINEKHRESYSFRTFEIRESCVPHRFEILYSSNRSNNRSYDTIEKSSTLSNSKSSSFKNTILSSPLFIFRSKRNV